MSERFDNSNRRRRWPLILGGAVGLLLLICCGCLLLPSLFPNNLSPTEPAATLALSELDDTSREASLTVTNIAPTKTTRPTQSLQATNTVQPTNQPTAVSSSTPSPRPVTLTPQPTNTHLPSPAPSSTFTPDPISTIETVSVFATVPAGDMATVTEIIDGDTIYVSLDGTTYRVRYIGMDTPENGDYYFSEATQVNSDLVAGETVILVKDLSETDQFGRLLRYVFLQDGTFVNAELVRLGYAQVATYPPDVRYQDLFVRLQQEAREAGRGLWATPTPTPTYTRTPVPTNTQTPVPTIPAQPTATNPPPPVPTQPPPTEPPSGNCDPAYPTVCIPPPPPDLDCGEIPYRNFTVLPPDPHRFDGDNDGIGCES